MASVPSERIRFDHGLSGLETLGVQSVSQLLDPNVLPNERAQPLPATRDRLRVRFPLPGTEDAQGHLTGQPGGAGTGWVVLERWHASAWVTLVHARFTRPRSGSLAERTWNLLCHLRAAGVGTPQPLAVGAVGAGPVSRNSFLVTRELVGFETPQQWLERPHRREARRHAFVALGAFLSSLLGSGVFLPRLGLHQLRISAVAEVDQDHECEQDTDATGFMRNRMPSVVLTDVCGGRLRARLSLDEAAGMLLTLRPADAAAVSGLELGRAFVLATRHKFSRSERRAIWQRLAAGP